MGTPGSETPLKIPTLEGATPKKFGNPSFGSKSPRGTSISKRSVSKVAL